MTASPKIAFFVTPHGFGHAARAAAVMAALEQRHPGLDFEIFTTIPEWFFEQSLPAACRVVPVVSDVGMVQIDPFREDPEATVSKLAEFWSGLEDRAARLIERWRRAPPSLIVSDISPLGLETARRLGVPSVLVENFAWDWIYAAYESRTPGLREFGARSGALVETATLRIQCAPACRPLVSAHQVGPVSRSPRASKRETRRSLGLDDSDQRPLVLLTLGGLGWRDADFEPGGECIYVTLGGTDRLTRSASIIRLPNRSPIYPPDLVWAADAVVAKLGYSTVAECFRAGARLGYLGRPDFPESPILQAFVEERLSSIGLTSEMIQGPAAGGPIRKLLALPQGKAHPQNGADEIADLVLARLS